MTKDFYTNLSENTEFRARFKADPAGVLAEWGIPGLQGKTLMVHENDSSHMHFTLLPKGTDIDSLQVDSRILNIQKKAWDDEAFRRRLLENPREAVMEFFGSLPPNLEITFHQNDEKVAHFILSPMSISDEELSDQDLEAVAGGKMGIDKACQQTAKGFARFMTEAPMAFAKEVTKIGDYVDKNILSGW